MNEPMNHTSALLRKGGLFMTRDSRNFCRIASRDGLMEEANVQNPRM